MCFHVMCVRVILKRAAAAAALAARRWKISDGTARSNTEQLETDGHCWCALRVEGKREERGGPYEERQGGGNFPLLYLLNV